MKKRRHKPRQVAQPQRIFSPQDEPETVSNSSDIEAMPADMLVPLVEGGTMDVSSGGYIWVAGWRRNEDGEITVMTRFAMPIASAKGFYKLLGCQLIRAEVSGVPS